MGAIIVKGRAARSALIQGLVAAVIFGTIPVTVKATAANPWTLALCRLVVAVAGIWFLAKHRRKIFAHSRSDLARLALLGVVSAAHWATYLYSIKLSSASVASLALSSFGVFLTFLGAWMARHRVGLGDFLPLALAVGGAVLVIPNPQIESRAALGFLLAVFSAFCFACLPLIHQRLSGFSGSHRIAVQYTVALLVLLPTLPAANWKLDRSDWLIVAYLGSVGTLLAHTLWAHATTTLPTLTTSLIYYLHIPIALVCCALFLGERLGPKGLVGGLLIVAASLWGVIRQQGERTESLPPE
jgi:DME family drug/metabolite transporter